MVWMSRLARGGPLIAGLAILVAAIAAVGVAYWWAERTGAGLPASGSDSTSWGPLAVVDFDTGAEALTAGTIRVTATCVTLEQRGNEPSVLVWYDKRTKWNAEAGEIVLQNRDGSNVILRNGEQVRFSGGGDLVAEGGAPGDEWIAGIDWVSKPDPACPNDSRWFVNEIVAAP